MTRYNGDALEGSLGLDLLLTSLSYRPHRMLRGCMDSPQRYVFETTDWRGRPVRMTMNTYEAHKERHAEIPEYINEAQMLIGDPDEVYIADVGPSLHLYRFGLGRGIYANTYLSAIVYYPEEK